MCREAKIANRKARNIGKGRVRHRVFRSVYRNLAQWEIEQWELTEE